MSKAVFTDPWTIVGSVLILGVVAHVAFTSVRAGGGPSPHRACISNLKQLALGVTMYTVDNDDRFPGRDVWMDATSSYIKNDAVFHCPDVVDESNSTYGYAFDGKLSFAAMPKEGADKAPLVFDSVNLGRNASGGLDSMPNPPRPGGGNVGYADGHVKTKRNP